MTKATTISINGRLYDAITGMPVIGTSSHNVAPQKPVAKTFSDIGPSRPTMHTSAHTNISRSTHAPAQAMHRAIQKSETLYRKALKKPAAHDSPAKKSPLIRHFQQHTIQPIASQPPVQAQIPDEIKTHPLVAKILNQKAEASMPKATGTALKEQLIRERLSEVSEHTPKKKGFLARQPKLATIMASTLSLLVLGGYLTYVNLPNISMKVAATRAGINASFPGYHPDGYSLNGPITYSPGQVTVSYKSNTNDAGFKLTEKSSNWDSQAVLDNYVSKQTGNYITFQDHGLTIYTFDNKAAWANGGMLYTVEGSTSLSSDQILRLATSL